MQEADGTELLDMLVRNTQAARIGPVVGPTDLARPVAWRVVQPAHVVHVSPLPYHLVAIHVRGPATARSSFAGTRVMERTTRPGDVTTLPAGCDWISELHSRVDFLHVLLPTDLVAKVAECEVDGARSSTFHERLARADRAVERLGVELLAAMSEGAERGTVVVDEIVGRLITATLGTTEQTAPGTSKGGLTPLQTRRAIDYMLENLAGDISLDDIAAAVGLSPYHFARCFRLSVGEPPHRFLTRARINHAKEMLSGSKLGISAVAAGAGFADQARLTKVFHAALGVPPGRYRKIIAS